MPYGANNYSLSQLCAQLEIQVGMGSIPVENSMGMNPSAKLIPCGRVEGQLLVSRV